MWCRALAEAAATVRGAENFGPKSRGKKKLKKAKFKSLAEGSLMSDTEENSVGEDYQVQRGGDPSFRDALSELMDLPHRNPSQRKRKAPRLLEEEMSAEKHWKKMKKDHSVRGNGTPGDKVGGGDRRGSSVVWDGLRWVVSGVSGRGKMWSVGGRRAQVHGIVREGSSVVEWEVCTVMEAVEGVWCGCGSGTG